MRKHFGIVAALMVFFLMAPVAGAAFPDVPADHWAYEAISQLVAAGLIEGLPDGTYQGNQPVTRFTMALYIARAMERLEQMVEDEIAKVTAEIEAAGTGRVIERIQLQPIEQIVETKVIETQVEKIIETVVEKPVEVEKIVERQIINRVGADSDEIKELVMASMADVIDPLEALINEFQAELVSIDQRIEQLRVDMETEFARIENYVLGHEIVPTLRIETAMAVAEVQNEVWDLEDLLAAEITRVEQDVATEFARIENYVLGHEIVPTLRIETAMAVAEVQNEVWDLEGRLDSEIAGVRDDMATEFARIENYVLGHEIVPTLRIETAMAVAEVQNEVWELESEIAALESRLAQLEDPAIIVSGTLTSTFEDIYTVGSPAYRDPNVWSGANPPVWNDTAVFQNLLNVNTAFRQEDGGVVNVDLQTRAINRFGYANADLMSIHPQVSVTTPGTIRSLTLGDVTVPTWSPYSLVRFPGLASDGKAGQGTLLNLVLSDNLTTDLILVRNDGARVPNYYWAGRTLAQVLPTTEVGLSYVAASPGPLSAPGLLDPRRDSKVGVSVDTSMGNMGLNAEYVVLPDVDDSSALAADLSLGLGAVDVTGRFVNVAPNFQDTYGSPFNANTDVNADYRRIYGAISVPSVMNLSASANMRSFRATPQDITEYNVGATVPVLDIAAGLRYNIDSDRADDILAVTLNRAFGGFGLEAGYAVRGSDAKIHSAITSEALALGAFDVTPGLSYRQDGIWDNDGNWDAGQLITGTLDIVGGAMTMNNVVLMDGSVSARTRLSIDDMVNVAGVSVTPRATYEYGTFWKDAPAQDTRYSLGANVAKSFKEFSIDSDVEVTWDNLTSVMLSSNVTYPVLSNVNLGLTGNYVERFGSSADFANDPNRDKYRATRLFATMTVNF